MLLGVYIALLAAGVAASSVLGVLRGYSAVYGVMIGIFAFAATALLGGWGAILSPIVVERWTRDLPMPDRQSHPVRWPYLERTRTPA